MRYYKSVMIALLAGCAPQPVNQYFETCDRAQFERVFLGCVEKARGPEHLAAAGNDLDEMVDECKDAANAIACEHGYRCVAHCGAVK